MEKQASEATQPEQDISEFSENPAFPKADLILVVEGKELYVNRQLLTEASPVFRAMLESDFKESTQDRIELPGKSYEAVVEFLKCTYPFLNYDITVNNLFKILPLADEYETSLKEKCEEFMINILRAKESFFIHRTDAFDIDQHEFDKCNLREKTSLLIKYPSDVPTATFNVPTTQGGFSFGVTKQTLFPQTTHSNSALLIETDANNVDDFNTIGFGKNGFEVGNIVPTEIVIEYILQAEKFGCNDFLKIAIQYVAMRNFSHFETMRGFSNISLETRFKITILRLRILENYKSNGFDINRLLFQK